MTCQSVGVVADGGVNMAQTAERVRRSLKAHKHTSAGVKPSRRSRVPSDTCGQIRNLKLDAAPEPPTGEREGGQDGSQPENQSQAHK